MIKAIITDIEGTTTSLSFVKDVLFPDARARMADYVHDHAKDAALRKLLDDVERECARSKSEPAMSDDEIIQQLLQWIDEDSKITPLKTIQGMIWEEGYRAGRFKGHLYADAAQRLRQWHAQGIRLYVFSSGSVKAQQLLFGFSDAGDLTPLFSAYFDTRIGNKREPEAYARIIEAIQLPAAEVLFLSDIGEELDAAKSIGINTTWLVREAALNPDSDHPQVKDFSEIQL